MKTYKKWLLASSLGLASTTAAYAACPAITMENDRGITGKYPQQFQLQEFESLANCTLSFNQNPDIKKLNARIQGNPSRLPAVEDRLPDEPLVIVPYRKIGQYGGVLRGLSSATESGTSDLLSVRHVGLVRYADDLTTIVPNIAKSYQWNSDFTELTFKLRKGHKWSDGKPFTAADVEFWYNNMILDTNIMKKPKDEWLPGGKPMKVKALDELTVVFKLAVSKRGQLITFARSYAQPFQPKHFLGSFHPAINPNADQLAKKAGFQNGYEVIQFYYGSSDWKDVPSPLLKNPSKIKKLPAAVVPTLESHILVEESTEGRRIVANPYFHMVDTAGNQLPYINEIDEIYIASNEVKTVKLINGEIDYKAQGLSLSSAPTLLDNKEKGNYSLDLRPGIGSLDIISFNYTPNDKEKRKLFSNINFRFAMSIGINRQEINEVSYFGLGKPQQYVVFDPIPEFVTEEQVNYATSYDPEKAKEMLDQLGVVDQNNDGFRDLPSGRSLFLNIQFYADPIALSTVELVAQNWQSLGFQVSLKEITVDEYRAAQSSNELDVLVGNKGYAIPYTMGNPEGLIVPFASYFSHRNGMLWHRYLDTNGKEGIKPPAWILEMKEKVIEWQGYEMGSPEHNKLGNRLVALNVDHLLFIGLVNKAGPVYRKRNLKNFEIPKVWAGDFRRTYPNIPQQWFFSE